MAKGAVVVRCRYDDLRAREDPVAELRRLAVYELRTTHGYSEEETAIVAEDAVLAESSRRQYVRFREAVARQKVPGDRDMRLRLVYARPPARGWMDRRERGERG